MDNIFILDGKVYDLVVTELERSFAVTDTGNSGRTKDYTMHRDIIGTFYNYSMKLYPNTDNLKAYDDFYQAITNPNAESHEMIFPFAQETLAFRAYVSQGKDKLVRRNGKNYWGMDGLSITFTAMEPQRRR